MSTTHASAVLGRRACAALAACSAGLHAAMVGRESAPAAMLILGMAVACLYCAYELWTGNSLRAWASVAVMNLVMIGTHLSAPGHRHGGAVEAATTPSTLMTVATSLAILEALIATAVLFARTGDTRVLLRQ